MQLIMWFRSLIGARRLTAAVRAASQWEVDALSVVNRLDADRLELTELREELRLLSNRLEADLEAAESIQQQHLKAVEQLRAENQVLAETTIPTLVASHSLLLKRIEADTANQVRILVAASGRNEE